LQLKKSQILNAILKLEAIQKNTSLLEKGVEIGIRYSITRTHLEMDKNIKLFEKVSLQKYEKETFIDEIK
jgi:hypothetical protein